MHPTITRRRHTLKDTAPVRIESRRNIRGKTQSSIFHQLHLYQVRSLDLLFQRWHRSPTTVGRLVVPLRDAGTPMYMMNWMRWRQELWRLREWFRPIFHSIAAGYRIARGGGARQTAILNGPTVFPAMISFSWNHAQAFKYPEWPCTSIRGASQVPSRHDGSVTGRDAHARIERKNS